MRVPEQFYLLLFFSFKAIVTKVVIPFKQKTKTVAYAWADILRIYV